MLHNMVVIFAENAESCIDLRFRGVRSPVSCQVFSESSMLVRVRVWKLKIEIELACKFSWPSETNLVQHHIKYSGLFKSINQSIFLFVNYC